MAIISFFQVDVTKKINEKKKLKEFLPLMAELEGKTLKQVSIIFCSDDYLLSVNRQFLNHDYYTDIITFDLSENENLISEIYISIDRVKENSSIHKSLFEIELQRVIFHGILHLCGFNDKTKKEKSFMTHKEDEYLIKFKSFHVKQ